MGPDICAKMLSEKLRAKFSEATRGYSMVKIVINTSTRNKPDSKLPVSMALSKNFFELKGGPVKG